MKTLGVRTLPRIRVIKEASMNFKGHICISGTRFVQVIKSQQGSRHALCQETRFSMALNTKILKNGGKSNTFHIWIHSIRHVPLQFLPFFFFLTSSEFEFRNVQKNIDGANMFGPVRREALQRGRLCWERRLNVSSTSGI